MSERELSDAAAGLLDSDNMQDEGKVRVQLLFLCLVLYIVVVFILIAVTTPHSLD